jgi:hypothetical protein
MKMGPHGPKMILGLSILRQLHLYIAPRSDSSVPRVARSPADRFTAPPTATMIPARITMIATTTITSISVNPLPARLPLTRVFIGDLTSRRRCRRP